MRNIFYIIKKIIIGICIGIGIILFKNSFVKAETLNSLGVYYNYSYFNGVSVTLNNAVYIDPNATYQWSFDNLGCSFPTGSFGNIDMTNEKLYVDIYFNTNASFEDYTGVTNGIRWTQYKIGEGIVDLNYQGNRYIKRFIFTPNAYGLIAQDVVTFYRQGTIVHGGGSVTWNSAFRVTDMSCGLLTDAPQVEAQDNRTLNAINNMTTTISNAITYSNQLMEEQLNWMQRDAQEAQRMREAMESDAIEENNQQFSEFQSYLAQNGVITNLVTLPITLFNKVLTTINSSCQPYSLGTLYDTEIILPCINVSNYIGSSLWGVIDILISGLLIYSISRHFVKQFNKMSSLEESDIVD